MACAVTREDLEQTAPTTSLLDQVVVLQQLLLKAGDRIERILAGLLAGDGLVELLLLFHEELIEHRHVPDVLLPVEAQGIGAVPWPEGVVFRRGIDAAQRALPAGGGKLELRVRLQPPFAEV